MYNFSCPYCVKQNWSTVKQVNPSTFYAQSPHLIGLFNFPAEGEHSMNYNGKSPIFLPKQPMKNTFHDLVTFKTSFAVVATSRIHIRE